MSQINVKEGILGCGLLLVNLVGDLYPLAATATVILDSYPVTITDVERLCGFGVNLNPGIRGQLTQVWNLAML